MYDALKDNNVDVFTIDELQIFMLLFSDDTVLFSYTKEGLQCLLNKLYSYCSQWGIHVNIDKTVVMMFKKGNRIEQVDLYYNNILLKNVKRFTYLGVTLSQNGCYFQTQKALAEQSMKALFSLKSFFDIISLNVTEKIKLFNCMIAPILNYGSEIWEFHKGPNIEKIHLKFLKQILNVKQQTMDHMVYGELGRVPMIIIRKIRIVKFWIQ